jgi:hypothetical protein
MSRFHPLWCRILIVSMLAWGVLLSAADWQWSVPDGEARAFLWIPADCQRVRGVVLSNHNMIEQGILEHDIMRRELAALGFAEVLVVPALDMKFDFHHGAGEHVERVMDALAQTSGYGELRNAPVVPMGHSASATYPWNFAAWNPTRTLAILSIHGDAPQTHLTGYGAANIDWGDRRIDGIPGMMVMGEYEWWEDRLAPALAFMAKNPRSPVAFLADAGCGHFDYSDETVSFLALFIRKAAYARLPAGAIGEGPVSLEPIDPAAGWRIDRWRRDQAPSAPSAPWSTYTGDATQAFWAFDKEMAERTEAHYARARGKKPQLLSITAADAPLGSGCGEPVQPHFIPHEDGVTFTIRTSFVDVVSGDPASGKPSRWTGLLPGTSIGHAEGGGPIRLSRIVGPVAVTGPDTCEVRYGRTEYTANRRNNDMDLLAYHPGDAQFKSMVQQARVRITPAKSGKDQHITFPVIPDQKIGAAPVALAATSDAGLKVRYYVLEGPAEIDGDTLRFTAIPPRAAFPVKVTVVAWQIGRFMDPKVKAAERAERSFFITR